MGRELEFKYTLTEEAFQALQARFAPFRQIRMQTTYYDTPDSVLGKRKWTLRRRMENDSPVCTLKTPGKDGARGEWECPGEDFRGLLALGAPKELEGLLNDLHPTCGAAFTRLAADVWSGSTRMELALDRGQALGGGKTAPIFELEIELKEGSDEAAQAYAREIAEEYGLAEQKVSKFRRAMELVSKTV